MAVDDADAVAARAQSAGAEVVMAPTDMGDVGRVSVLSHPVAGMLHVMQYTQPFQ